jgi:hypothetical protein
VRARSSRWRAAATGFAVTLAACQGERATAPAAATLAAPPPVAPPPAGLAPPPQPGLCTVLAAVVATESEGFARLRGRALAAERWLGRETLPGTERCTIEGETWPHARYSCAGASFAAWGRDDAGAAFEALADELGECLESPIWFPRAWQQGTAFEFAMGERLQAWTDPSTAPPSQVVLKVQHDAGGDFYRVQLDLEAVP